VDYPLVECNIESKTELRKSEEPEMVVKRDEWCPELKKMEDHYDERVGHGPIFVS